MSEINRTDIPTMSVERTVEKLGKAYCAVIKKGLPVKTVPSVMLWGPPGIGK